jgi:radical SAM superfamily enzyme YgiQ (UPF0313 family)
LFGDEGIMLKNQVKILFSSVFKPYGVDDEYGRKENIMELFHNQVTREQGIFSLRYNHRSSNLYLLAENINIPSTILDFPSLKRFIKEIKKGYDYIGISFITPNFSKTKKMAELIRKYSPNSKIILGGHGTQIPELEELIDCDYIVRGEGISWLRKFFGEPVDAPIKHPILPSAENKRIMGIPMLDKSVVLLPGVGCPNACRFCSTSHLFKFEYIPFFKTARELFEIMRMAENKLGCSDFFIMDENFFKSKERAVDLLGLMKTHDKPYFLSIFSSAETIKGLGVKFLFEIGIRFIWIGVESKQDNYEKNKGIDMKALFNELRNHGISILASTILFQEHHTQKTIWEDIDYTLDLRPDFVQFMQLGPLPQTALYKEYKEKGLLREDIPYEEWHGQHQLWFKHPHFTPKESEIYLRKAFQKDFHELGPSILRMFDTIIKGYKHTQKYQNDPWLKMRTNQLRELSDRYYPLLSVTKPYLPNNKLKQFTEMLNRGYEELFKPKISQKLISRAASLCALKEYIKFKFMGDVRQPKTIYTKYRRPAFKFFPERLKGRMIADLCPNLLEIKLGSALTGQQICIELHGILDSVNVEKLRNQITNFFKKEKEAIVLNLVNMQKIEGDSLYNLVVQLEQFHSRIKLLYSTKKEGISHMIEKVRLDFGTDIQCVPAH